MDVYQPFFRNKNDLKTSLSIGNSITAQRFNLLNFKMAYAVNNNIYVAANYTNNLNTNRNKNLNEYNFGFGFYKKIITNRMHSKFVWQINEGGESKNVKRHLKLKLKNDYRNLTGKQEVFEKTKTKYANCLSLNLIASYSKAFIKNNELERLNFDIGFAYLSNKISVGYNLRLSAINFQKYAYNFTVLDFTPEQTFDFIVQNELFFAASHNIKINFTANKHDYYIKYNRLAGNYNEINGNSKIHIFSLLAYKHYVSLGFTINWHHLKK